MPACLPCLPALPACLPCLPCHACLPACLPCLPALPACPAMPACLPRPPACLPCLPCLPCLQSAERMDPREGKWQPVSGPAAGPSGPCLPLIKGWLSSCRNAARVWHLWASAQLQQTPTAISLSPPRSLPHSFSASPPALLLQIADMHKKRGAHASCAGPGGLLYVVGGYDVSNPENEYMADGGSAQHAKHARHARLQPCKAWSQLAECARAQCCLRKPNARLTLWPARPPACLPAGLRPSLPCCPPPLLPCSRGV